jgi:hypothetical protein
MGISSSKQDNTSISLFADQIRISNGSAATLCIYDIGGQLVAQYKLKHETEYVSSSFLKKGIYICLVRKENRITSLKLLK